MSQSTGLGRGLSSLISDETLASFKQAYIPDLPIDNIIPNQYQPRVEMDPSKLVELADSIREHGVIEPLIVTQNSSTEFELIAGERRWRASKLAGLKKVPVVVKDASPQQMLELAIVENIQREDLNPLEEALSFDHLAKKFNLTHGDIAKKVGYSRPAVANKIRLLQLPEELKKGLVSGTISEGHARSLLGLDNVQTMEAAYRIIIRDGLSVRATEKLVQRLRQEKSTKKKPKKVSLTPKLRELETKLQKSISSEVKLTYSSHGGKITIPFKNEKELQEIISHMS
ncbi:ParB/RepB/Spo0J family partition protein [Candidatus Dojkabacteria bacterium]|uniref:ParB/RepB/Spo0J family partition protein n=1 Tax=Candidatus Dojkabacteria bacterium TaxID=2099670 RepID=A0A955L813_9BACT|nr:ParB/RepB/Spo0J family partition protein [Candidatus Dojkabacteria bacterium]